jgi:hypothetical protein
MTSRRTIPLTRGLHAIVDAADYERLSRFNWRAKRSSDGRTDYPVRSAGRDVVFMHQDILGLGRGEHGDHRNHNGLDNRQANLRRCSHAQNMQNRRLAVGATGFRGVTAHKRHFRAKISCDGRRLHIGCFASAEAAARAYDEAAIKLHGAFARPNFPPFSEAAKCAAPRQDAAA